MSKFNLKAILCAVNFALVFLPLCATEDILGCGGFIKSHTSIDFTKVHIKLYTKSGNLKDQTECAPNNGYYFLPLYDKGEYLLKVDPPKGWSFEPNEVILNVDGISDPCSLGKDINFSFKGFGITGKVASKFSNTGPKGLAVKLFKENENTPIKVTKTDQEGVFYFTPVKPGKYKVVAVHETWIFEKDTVNVIVSEENTKLPDNSLVVFGYEVSGRVTSEGDPVSGVTFLLFGHGEVKNCLKSPIKGYEKRQDLLCHVTSDKNGRFIFPTVTVGKYSVVPFYADTLTKFDVQPSELTFLVDHNSLILTPDFKVTGFSVHGEVKSDQNGEPLEGVKISLQGKLLAVTDKNGKYKIDNIKTGQYQLKAEAENFSFKEKSIKIFPSEPKLSTIFPSAYKACGKVTLPAKGTLQLKKVNIKNMAGTFNKIIDTDSKTGEFCLYLESDTYIFNVIVTDEEKNKGLQFFPPVRKINIVGKPVKDINFLQLKTTLKGTVECLKGNDCSKATIILKTSSGVTVHTIKAKDGKYEFNEILPGQYQVLIDTDEFCWSNPKHNVVVYTEFAEIPPFIQTGFSMTFISSHDTTLEYMLNSKKLSLQLTKGSTTNCFPEKKSYEFIPKSCHVYPKNSYEWDVNNKNPLMLTSNIHRHKGYIVSAKLVKDVRVKIEGEIEPIILGPLPHTITSDNKYNFEFEFNAVAEKTYIITPISDVLLFTPETKTIVGMNDCQNNIVTFLADLGKIISCSISPPLSGVTIKILTKDKEQPLHTLVTNNDGTYKVGPLNGMLDYSVLAEKEGFVISGPDSKGIFTAHKLAEIVVDVHDKANEVTLQGVLLSLTGGDSYRKNSITGDSGQMVFDSLSPGKYYLRPMMKEYRFEPPSKMINVEEGATIKVKLAGKRVAFSAYGSVTSLNREPEPGLVVEAQGQTNCSHLQEEATTEENGNFRIRGLQPTCIYAIRLKSNAEANSRIQRASPSSIAVQLTEDVHNLRLVVFHLMTRVDLTAHVISNPPEHYRTLRLKLCREDNPDSPIHSTKLDNLYNPKSDVLNAGQLVHFPPLQLNQKYFIQLESTLSKSIHKYKTTPVYFEANSSFKYVKINFETVRRQDHGDVGQTSIVALPFIMLVALAFLYRDKLWSYLNILVEKWSKPVPPSRSTPIHAIPIDPRADDIIVEQIMNINKRKMKPRKV